MGIVDKFIQLRDDPNASVQTFNNISKEKIRKVLAKIDRSSENMVEAVYALLDQMPNQFSKAAKNNFSFKDGATTAHIGAHVGILQRGRSTKLDREGRDYWLKPLWEIGAIEKVYFDGDSCKFLPGHPKAKSPNSAYRLPDDFVDILASPDGEWEIKIENWFKSDNLRERLAFQAQQAEETKSLVVSEHSLLIEQSAQSYAARFLPGYEVVYIDDGDGDRITEEQKNKLEQAGLVINLDDAMPDVLLWNKESDSIWIIEAVTSDGEVDLHKQNRMFEFCLRQGKKSAGFTTTYPTWKKFAERQSVLKNIAYETYVWIREDAAKHFFVSTSAGTAFPPPYHQ
ncbi:MAG: hypothetical protein HWE12_00125 [Oceanospirillaceae bacterium]|nr:hypothetical protein [Oceanospirillaceae bacterium]